MNSIRLAEADAAEPGKRIPEDAFDALVGCRVVDSDTTARGQKRRSGGVGNSQIAGSFSEGLIPATGLGETLECRY